MIAGYTRPQLLIRELLQKLPNVDPLSLHAFVFGPQFDLFRYYRAAEKALMKGTAFTFNSNTADSARQVVAFEGLKANHVVDTSFTKLFAENLEGLLWTANSPTNAAPNNPYTFRLPSLANSNQILVTLRGAKIQVSPTAAVDTNGKSQMATVTVVYAGSGYTPNAQLVVPVIDPAGVNPGQGAVVQLTVDGTGAVASGIVIASGTGYTASASIIFDAPPAPNSANVGVDDSTLIPDLHGRPVQAGDIVYVTCNSTTYRRVIQSVTQQMLPPQVGTNGNGLFAAATSNPIETDAFSFQNATAPFGWTANLAHTSVTSIAVTAAGSGYTSSSVLTLSAPTAVNSGVTGVTAWATVQATASVVLSAGGISSVVVAEPGTGYFDNGVVKIVVSTAGTGYTVAPQVAISAPNDVTNGIQAKAIAHIASGGVTAIEVVDPGAGYTSTPTATLVGGDGHSAAAGACTVAAPPTVTGVTVGSGATFSVRAHSKAFHWSGLVQGSTYQNKYGERYTITCTKAGTTGALVRVRSASGGFSADNIVPTLRGNIYTIYDPSLGGVAIDLNAVNGQSLELGDQFTFVIFGKYLPLALAPTGQVVAVNVLNSGTGYSAGGVITFVAPPTGGRVAKAKIASVTSGAITGITIIDPGQGYVYPPAVSAIAGGSGALLQAIISTPSNSCSLAVVPGSTYQGPVNNRYILKVVAGIIGTGQDSFTGAKVSVTDTAGVDTSSEITVQHGVNYNLGSFGLQFMFPSGIVDPTGISGSTATATITSVDGGGAITGVSVTAAGSGYVVAPVVTITALGSGSGAALQAVLNNGVVEDVIIISGGANYSTNDTLALAAPVTYQPGLRTGDVYYLDVTAPALGGSYNTLVLRGQATDITGWSPTDVLVNLCNISVCALYTGEIPKQGDPADAPVLSWNNGSTGILVTHGLKINVPARDANYQWVPVQTSTYGRLFSSWRGLVPATGTNAARAAQNRFYTKNAIIATFGVEDQDNPVCYGACRAFDGAQGKSIFVSSLPSNDLAGYTAVLNQAAKVQGPYTLAPMTDDAEVKALAKVHVDSCSVFNKRLWRRVYISTTSPGPYAVYSITSDGSSLQGSVLTNGTGFVRVVAPNAKFIDELVQPGDLYRTYFVPDAWGNSTYQDFPISEVLENNELILSSGPSAAITPAIRFEIWRPDTSATQAEFVGDESEAYADRRVINVWSDNPVIFDTETAQYIVTPVYYLAAEIAGIRSALLPQQGLTTTELTSSLNAAPSMYTKYTDDDLAQIASHGTMIVTQDVAGGPAYIYHQLTTDSKDGSMYYEDSVGTSFDSLAYKFAAELQQYIGKRNATPAVVEELDVRIRRILDDEKKAPADLSNIGAALVDWDSLVIEIDQTMRDKINVRVRLIYPLPLNTIDVTLEATIIQGEVSTVTLVTTGS